MSSAALAVAVPIATADVVTWNSVPEEPTLILVAVTTPTVILPSESCKSIPAAVTIPLTLAFLTTNSLLK